MSGSEHPNTQASKKDNGLPILWSECLTLSKVLGTEGSSYLCFCLRKSNQETGDKTKTKTTKQTKQANKQTKKKNHNLCHLYKSLHFPLHLCHLWELEFWTVFESILVHNLKENDGDLCIVCIIWREKLIILIYMDIRYSAMNEPYVLWFRSKKLQILSTGL